MLYSYLKLLVGVSAVTFAVSASSQEATYEPPPGNPYQVDKETFQKIQEEFGGIYSEQAFHDMMDEEKNPDIAEFRQNFMANSKENVDKGEEKHQATLRGMGIDTTKTLYIAVSNSMPKPLLQAYAREAMWYGGKLIVRGVPKGQTVIGWVKEMAKPLVENKTAAATIQIDPQIFDRYGVIQVPTIIWDEDAMNMGQRCQGFENDTMPETVLRAALDRPVEIDVCPPKYEDTYYKISGTVTIDWALEQFIENGAQGAQERLDQGRRYLEGGEKDQQAFNGDWNAEASPQQQSIISQAYERARDLSKQSTKEVETYFREIQQ